MRILILLLTVLLAATACTPAGKTVQEQQDLERQAREYVLQEDYPAAATEYLRLAEEYDVPRFRILAAENFLLADDPARANEILATIDAPSLDALATTAYQLLQARMALQAGAPDDAVTLVNIPLPDNVSTELATRYHQVRAETYTLTDQPMLAVQERVQLSPLLDNSTAIKNNAGAIWELLSAIDPAGLDTLQANAGPVLQGWIALKRIDRSQLYAKEALTLALDNWRAEYPAHPANLQIVPDILARADEINLQPQSIALLLPFNDQYREASSAIREGFLAAWYRSDSIKPAVKIYDTSAQDIMVIYQQAVTEGAEFIVGPLTKEAVARLDQEETLPVPTLALNQVSHETGSQEATALPKLFQFGLLPEEEATNTADRAWFDGHARALVIATQSDWGNRVTTAFTGHWRDLGGEVLEQTLIPQDSEDLSDAVKQLLNIDDSERREKELTAMLRRTLHFEPRRRQDADVVFLAAPPVIARQLIPQMRFYRADDLPVYSISRVFHGMHDPSANSDINDVVFPDMPWVVDPGHKYAPLQQTLNRNWSQDESPYRRLYAFGIDAFRLVSNLGKLLVSGERYNGETGRLRVNRDGVIRREQAWARITEGSPQLLDSPRSN